MKFLTIVTIKDVYYTLPQSEQRKLGVSSFESALELKKKMGDKYLVYTVPGWGRSVSIFEVSSVEELAQILAQIPMVQAELVNLESYPLIEADVKALEAALASDKARK